jgi:hypothetical protein
MDEINFDEWLAYGHGKGWITAAVCLTHDGTPTTASEDEQFENGDDPCIHGLRLLDSPEHRREVELNHGPSVWRASNAGLTVVPD